MNFGVSGQNIGLSNLAIHRNPVTLAAIKRQQEKERLSIPPSVAREEMRKITERMAMAKSRAEEEWHAQFQQAIKMLRLRHAMGPSLAALHQRLTEYHDQHDQHVMQRITAEQVLRDGVVGTPFTVEDVKGPRRHKPLVQLRMILMAKVYLECPHLSLPQIGKSFGGRDHTTVLHAVTKMGVHQPAKQYGLRTAYRLMAA